MKITADETISLLKRLISIPSFSREEGARADELSCYLQEKGLPHERSGNNLIAKNKFFNPELDTILLNSHLDTVRPNENWTSGPFDPVIRNSKLYGLGSNDAGGALVCLLNVFIDFFERDDLSANLVFLASAEEEISGTNGVSAVIPKLPEISFGIVGEPTGMRMAIAEKGLMVLDCKARGKSGHAAREEGVNAIERAIEDIRWFMKYRFPEESALLGDVKMTVTMINAGIQHNVIPDTCEFVVDVRSTDQYSNEKILEVVRKNISSEVIPRSTRLQPSSIPEQHRMVEAARKMGIDLFGSATLSDQALMPFPTVKIGPGESERSHTADEYITLDEIRQGIKIYHNLLDLIL